MDQFFWMEQNSDGANVRKIALQIPANLLT